ncbi:MAG: ribosomal protein [Thermodesulfobacteriota bacterium]|nr:ribosomal protein [Thermodesulfobacteriota bacterium]
MARYRDSVCRFCRRETTKLFLKGDRCYSDKCSVERRNYPPGQHGQGRSKYTDYGVQLREKQKVRRIYGLLEKQFRNYAHLAEQRRGVTGENLLLLLESRLDNIVYRMGFASSRSEARQLINHGHFLVNGKKVDIASFLTKPGMVIEVKEKSKKLKGIEDSMSAVGRRPVPQWLEVEPENFKGTIKGIPTREELPPTIREQLIVEFYSK